MYTEGDIHSTYVKHLSYIQINKEAVLHNLALFKKRTDSKISVVVKGNAYGHGLAELSTILDGKVDYFQVDDYEELVELRKHTQTKALVLGYVQLERLPEVKNLNAIPGLYNVDSINAYDGEYHLKIDAYFGRQGVLTSNLDEFLNKITNKKLTGVYMHFSSIDNPTNLAHFEKQLSDFKLALEKLKQHGFQNFAVHTNGTSGSLVNVDLKTDITRLGIGLYGIWPSKQVKNIYESKVGTLTPILSWVTHIAQVKTIPQGFPVGYGLTYIADSPKKIAIIPQGYSDGYDRRFSNTSEVLIRDTRCKTLGRIAMNMFVVDVTHLENVKAEDEAVLIGKSLTEEMSANELAEKCGTTSYELLTRISPLLPRVIV